LPQLVYTSEEGEGPAQAERWAGVVRDASAVEWKPALRAALILAVPTGLLFGGTAFLGFLGLFWMAAAAAWAVMLYARWERQAQRPGWLTVGAGARIGLVTGLICGWFAFVATGISLYADRFVFRNGKDFDDTWQAQVTKMSEQWQAIGSANHDQQIGAMSQTMTSWLLSSEGRAGSTLGGLMMVEAVLVVLAVAGGAVGARLLARPRRPEAEG
jgi:hypothetical protein